MAWGAIVLAVLASGCGGDSEASTLTKAEFVKQANGICSERRKIWQEAQTTYLKEIKAQQAEADPKAQKIVVQGIVEKDLFPALQAQLEKLEVLGSPPGKEKQVGKMVSTLSETLDSIEEKGLVSLVETNFKDFEEEAKDLGVNCPLL